MKKFGRVGVILLFLVGALVQPHESRRVLIKGKAESVLVLQTLQKAPERPPGNPGSYTPGGPKLAADTTNTRAFAGRAMARGYSCGIPKFGVATDRK
ncbi:BHLH domain-containing protein [Psidium guajava]|nr:BHLH domain-containing protein [Psidium guajava]